MVLSLLITSTFLDKGKIPIIAENDREAIKISLNTLNGLMRLERKKNIENVKLCTINSTLHHVKMLVSKGLYDELFGCENIEFYGEFESLKFDKDSNLK